MSFRRVFISYRRADSLTEAYLIKESLEVIQYRQGAGYELEIFFDLASLPGGKAYLGKIAHELHHADALLAIIGPDWLCPRLFEADDLVRREIETGLHQAETRVIPVLVRGAEMPKAEDLPDGLAELVEKTAVIHLPHYHAEAMEKIVKAIERPDLPLLQLTDLNEGHRQKLFEVAVEGGGTNIFRTWCSKERGWSYHYEHGASIDDELNDAEDLTGGGFGSFKACWVAAVHDDFSVGHPGRVHPEVRPFVLEQTLQSLDRRLQGLRIGSGGFSASEVELQHRRWLAVCGYGERMKPTRPGMIKIDAGCRSHKDSPSIAALDIAVDQLGTCQALLNIVYHQALVSRTGSPMVPASTYGTEWYLVNWRTGASLRPCTKRRFRGPLSAYDVSVRDILQVRYGPLEAPVEELKSWNDD